LKSGTQQILDHKVIDDDHRGTNEEGKGLPAQRGSVVLKGRGLIIILHIGDGVHA